MNAAPAVVVKKGGALSALFYGISMVLTTGILSASLLGLYGLRVFDRRVAGLGELGETLVQSLPHWQQSLPPVLADAFNDRRAPEYVGQIEVRARLVGEPRDGRQRVLVEVANRGKEAISLLALNLVLEDTDGIPLHDVRSFAATPLALSDPQIRGPLYPGLERRYAEWVAADAEVASVEAEVVQLRVFNPAAPRPPVPPAGGDEAGESSVD